MRTVRFTASSSAQPAHGLLESDQITPLTAAPWAGGRPVGNPIPREQAILLAPVEPTKIVCVGRNYRDHIEEMGFEIPTIPSLFYKPLTTILDPGGDVILPPTSLSTHVEHEAELAVVIGSKCRNLTSENAVDAIFGITCANDVTSRDLPPRDGNTTRAKSFDTYCPIGPWIETDLDLAAGVQVRCTVNGEVRQDGNTQQLVFDVARILELVTQVMTLAPGDVVLTGSPGGTGPLTPGDRVEIEVAGIGPLVHGVRAGG
jgi:2-keto-4-pentenoate hydratase/2-oxohepta-3-ene-1,7-dioic acid hydratase in catechol pathway